MNEKKSNNNASYTHDGTTYTKRDGVWYKMSIFFAVEYSCEEEEVPEEVLRKDRICVEKEKRLFNDSFKRHEYSSTKLTNHSFKKRKLSGNNVGNRIIGEERGECSSSRSKSRPESSVGNDKKIKKNADRFEKRSLIRYDVLEVALKEVLRIENMEEKIVRPVGEAEIKGKKTVLDLRSDGFNLTFENDFFQIGDYFMFCESRNLVPMDFFNFFMFNENRVARYDEQGECVYCKTHKVESHSSPMDDAEGKKCPYIRCNCVKCHVLDQIAENEIAQAT